MNFELVIWNGLGYVLDLDISSTCAVTEVNYLKPFKYVSNGVCYNVDYFIESCYSPIVSYTYTPLSFMVTQLAIQYHFSSVYASVYNGVGAHLNGPYNLATCMTACFGNSTCSLVVFQKSLLQCTLFTSINPTLLQNTTTPSFSDYALMQKTWTPDPSYLAYPNMAYSTLSPYQTVNSSIQQCQTSCACNCTSYTYNYDVLQCQLFNATGTKVQVRILPNLMTFEKTFNSCISSTSHAIAQSTSSKVPSTLLASKLASSFSQVVSKSATSLVGKAITSATSTIASTSFDVSSALTTASQGMNVSDSSTANPTESTIETVVYSIQTHGTSSIHTIVLEPKVPLPSYGHFIAISAWSIDIQVTDEMLLKLAISALVMIWVIIKLIIRRKVKNEPKHSFKFTQSDYTTTNTRTNTNTTSYLF